MRFQCNWFINLGYLTEDALINYLQTHKKLQFAAFLDFI